MNFEFVQWLFLMMINQVSGEFLQISLASVNMSMILKTISTPTITACHMTCAKESLCHFIAVTFESPNPLLNCHLIKDENGHYDGENEMTTIKAMEYGVQVDGQWGCWRSISACNVSCGGGVLNQTRDCDSPRPAHGGDNCTGPANRTVKCNEQNCPVNGQWGDWTNTTNCTVPCGGGSLNQSRQCDSPKPKHGGDGCAGPRNRTAKCNEGNCRVVNIALNKPATQVQTEFVASKAVDGNLNTYSSTGYFDNPWWQLDLGTDVQIEYMIFRGDDYPFKQNRYKGVVVSGRMATESRFQTCKDLGNLDKLVVRFSCDANQKFRFIRIQLSRGYTFLYINEFEVYAKQK